MTKGLSDLDRYCLGQLRAARTRALEDAEAFPEVCFALERIGAAYGGKREGLGKDKPIFANLAAAASLSQGLSPVQHQCHGDFERLFAIVKAARNDALHHGAFVRHATRHAVEFCLMLEDGILSKSALVSDFMVRDPVCAELWQPLSLIRQQMLANSFSYLPVALKPGEWALIADLAIAKAAPRTMSGNGRKAALALPLGKALTELDIALLPAKTLSPAATIGEAVAAFTGPPILVVSGEELRGIVTPFDLL